MNDCLPVAKSRWHGEKNTSHLLERKPQFLSNLACTLIAIVTMLWPRSLNISETEKKEATYIVVYGHGILSYTLQVRVTILAISHQLAPAEAGVRSQKGQYGLRGGRRGTWDRFLSENVYTPPVSLQQWSILKQHSSTIIATNLSNW